MENNPKTTPKQPRFMGDLLALSITDLKRAGYIVPGEYRTGPITWERGGRVVASMAVAVDTAPGRVPFIRFVFNHKGTPADYTAALRFTPSNLNRGGYYMFVCPVTGRSCRKLYFVGGRFISRFAFRAMYAVQGQSTADRYADALERVEQARKEPGRRLMYAGKPTRYALRVQRLTERAERLGASVEDNRRNQAPANQGAG